MEPNTIYAKREGNLAGEIVDMSVDAASMAHVMSILTDLYSNPTLAVIREYSTNAFDSHKAAGVTRPIEVSTPNGLSQFFKVRDFGVGLDVEDIRNVYSKYGASTKRSTNDQVGMLGLGCKSALTYTQQFTIRSVKDGKLALVAISRTESGAGQMQIVHTSDVDEENGVEISVPVERYNTFEQEAKQFFSYWEPGTVLLNGQEPARVDGTKISDNIMIHKGARNDYIVMGNVAYRVSNDHALYNSTYRYGIDFGIVATVGIGEVDFTPSREDLHYTKRTIETIEKVRKAITDGMRDTIQSEIDSKDTHVEARKCYEEWKRIASNYMKDITYKGEHIPDSISGMFWKYRPDAGRYSTSTYVIRDLTIQELERSIIVNGYTETDGISTYHRSKLRLWSDVTGKHGSYVLSNGTVDMKWIKNDRVVTWEEVFATKKPRVPKTESVESFFVMQKGTRYGKNITEFPDDKMLVLYTNSDEKVAEYISQIVSLSDDVLAVRLAKNRWDKFTREHKNVISLRDYLDKMMQKAYDGLTEEDKVSMSLGHYDRGRLCYLDATKVDDPELVRYIEVARRYTRTDTVDFYSTVKSVTSSIRMYDIGEKFEAIDVTGKYPLLGAVNGEAKQSEHFYLYANALYNKDANV